jgi:hypothetical protein
VVADHLLRITVDFTKEATPIFETFPNEQLMHIAHTHSPWFANIVNYLVTGHMPLHWGWQDKSKFMTMVKYFFWDDPYLFKCCPLDWLACMCGNPHHCHIILLIF